MHANRILCFSAILWLLPLACLIADEFSGEIRFSPEEIVYEKTGVYDFIRIKDGVLNGPVGSPALPVIQRDVPIPWNAEALYLSVFAVETMEIEGQFNIPPMTQPRTLSGPEPEEDPFKKDSQVYESDSRYPGIFGKHLSIWSLVGQRMAKLVFHPLQYNPRTGKLYLATQIRFRVTWDQAQNMADVPTFNLTSDGHRYYEEALNKESLAPVTVAPYSGSNSRALPAGQYEHVIISPQAFETAWEDLAEWRTLRGFPSVIVTKEYISTNYSGSTTRAKIRSFIMDAHSTWGARYFLLGADGGSGTNEIPYHTASILSDSIANDTYYADYDGDWVIEVQVGRATVTNTTQIGQFIDKVLHYEKTPPLSNYGKKVFFMAFDLDSSTPGEDTKEIIDTNYIPGNITLQTEYDSESGAHLSDVISYLNNGPNLVNHIDHCNWNVWGMGYTNHSESMVDSHVDGLSNGWYLFNWYTLGCLANAWDNSQSLSENMMREVGNGSVSFTGNTMYGWYAPGYPDLCSSLYDILWWHVLFTDNQYHVGDALSAHKNDYFPDDDYYRYAFTELSLLGDPGMPLWKDDPTALTVTFNDPVSTGSQSYDINVKDGGTNLSGAKVCLWKLDEVYAYDTTNAQGNCSLSIAPATAGTMNLTVTAQDYVPFENLLTVMESAPPEISDVTPADGSINGNTACTIDGFYFTTTPDTTVTFGGSAASNISVVDANTITCNSPAHTAGTVDLQVSNSNGSDTLSNAFTYHEAPSLSSVSPNHGPSSGNMSVTLTGSRFTPVGTTTVTFGNVSATGIVVINSTTVTCTTPAHSAGAVDVRIVNDFGSDTLSNGYTYDTPPTLTGIDPENGPIAGGTAMILSGQGFTTSMDTDVYFGGTAATNVTVVNSTTIQCNTPAHAAGVVDVQVSNSNGSDLLVNAFEYHNPPNVVSIFPNEGPTQGSTTVTIFGNSFTPSALDVTFDGIGASNIAVTSSTTITCDSPSHAAGSVDVEVSNSFGSGTLYNGFTYINPPALSSLYPTQGSSSGGTAVTMTGQHFDASENMAVYFGGTAATDVVIVNSITLTCTTPAHAPGTVDVMISNEFGSDTLSNGFAFNNLPVITGLAPTDGPVAGGTAVTITGQYFTTAGDTDVYFGGTLALNLAIIDANTMTCDVPAHAAGTVDVEVTNSNGSDSLSNAFTYHNAPAIISLAPILGLMTGGSAVTLTGTDFTEAGNMSILFGGAPATNMVVVNSTTITC
ncbi:MAG: IPT/TIG domain-containing protein, partial [Planctomycetota bacterium]